MHNSSQQCGNTTAVTSQLCRYDNVNEPRWKWRFCCAWSGVKHMSYSETYVTILKIFHFWSHHYQGNIITPKDFHSMYSQKTLLRLQLLLWKCQTTPTKCKDACTTEWSPASWQELLTRDIPNKFATNYMLKWHPPGNSQEAYYDKVFCNSL